MIENLSKRCGGFLRKLSLRGCQSISDDSMKTLACSCNNLEDINLNECKKLTDKCVRIDFKRITCTYLCIPLSPTGSKCFPFVTV